MTDIVDDLAALNPVPPPTAPGSPDDPGLHALLAAAGLPESPAGTVPNSGTESHQAGPAQPDSGSASRTVVLTRPDQAAPSRRGGWIAAGLAGGVALAVLLAAALFGGWGRGGHTSGPDGVNPLSGTQPDGSLVLSYAWVSTVSGAATPVLSAPAPGSVAPQESLDASGADDATSAAGGASPTAGDPSDGASPAGGVPSRDGGVPSRDGGVATVVVSAPDQPTPEPTSIASALEDNTGYMAPPLAVLVQLKDGTLSLDTDRCLVEPTLGTYTMGSGGAWFFQPANPSSTAACSDPEAAAYLETLINTLSGASRWSYVDNSPDLAGAYYVFQAGFCVVWLQVPDADNPLPTFGSLAPQPLADTDADLAALLGTWSVDSLRGQDTRQGGDAITWTAVVSGEGPLVVGGGTRLTGQVGLPDGCNTGDGGSFLATSDGRWFFGLGGARTALGCAADSPAAQSEAVYDALLDARTWRVVASDTDTLRVAFDDADGAEALVLSRPAVG